MCQCMTAFSFKYSSVSWSRSFVILPSLLLSYLAFPFLEKDDGRGSGR